ncbi:MAG: type II toxin-antitoxin system RelE/ParE family toxin [Polyangiaceae bacterium]|nr:type II toxin-antitoxin system RelE/ParE family toxin [Polyangiaceae bacterium]MCL4750571.1 type II toxin-antitoxin system RelE/ParE family toxin [Myxococcales bacterium]
MPRVVLEPEAERDITDAYDWYEEQRSGLGERFLASVAESLEQIARAPKANPIVERSVRRKLLRTFPYSVLYRDSDDTLFVVACFHGKRDPAVRRRRL